MPTAAFPARVPDRCSELRAGKGAVRKSLSPLWLPMHHSDRQWGAVCLGPRSLSEMGHCNFQRFRSATSRAGIEIVRLPALVFGGKYRARVSSPFSRAQLRLSRITILPIPSLGSSRSVQRSASNSPWRAPTLSGARTCGSARRIAGGAPRCCRTQRDPMAEKTVRRSSREPLLQPRGASPRVAALRFRRRARPRSLAAQVCRTAEFPVSRRCGCRRRSRWSRSLEQLFDQCPASDQKLRQEREVAMKRDAAGLEISAVSERAISAINRFAYDLAKPGRRPSGSDCGG